MQVYVVEFTLLAGTSSLRERDKLALLVGYARRSRAGQRDTLALLAGQARRSRGDKGDKHSRCSCGTSSLTRTGQRDKRALLLGLAEGTKETSTSVARAGHIHFVQGTSSAEPSGTKEKSYDLFALFLFLALK